MFSNLSTDVDVQLTKITRLMPSVILQHFYVLIILWCLNSEMVLQFWAGFSLWGSGVHCWGRHDIHAILGRHSKVIVCEYRCKLVSLIWFCFEFLVFLIDAVFIYRWWRTCFYKRGTLSKWKMWHFQRGHMLSYSLTQKTSWIFPIQKLCELTFIKFSLINLWLYFPTNEFLLSIYIHTLTWVSYLIVLFYAA